MDIPLSLKETAVLEIFRDYQIPVNGRLPYADLRRDWQRTGLRSSDLDLTLYEMVGAGALQRAHDDDGAMFILTEIGKEMITSVPSARSFLAAARDAYTLKKFARRPRGGMPASCRRRGASGMTGPRG